MEKTKGRLCSDDADYKKYGIHKDKREIREDGKRLEEKNFVKGQYEWWYFDGHLDDGSIIVSAFIVQVDEKGQLIPQITFNYADKDNRIDKIVFFKAGEYESAKDHCDVKIKNNFFQGKGLDEYEIFLDPSLNDGWGFNLKLIRQVPSFRPATGHWTSNEDFMAWFCAVPSGQLEGTITKAGKEVKVKGNGYHDHNWGNVPMSKILSDWYWGRGDVEGLTVVTACVRFKDEAGGNETPLVYVTKGENILLDANNEELAFLSGHKIHHPETVKAYNSDVLYIYENGNDRAYIRLNGKDSIVAYSSVEWENPGWETKYLRFAAEASVDMNLKGSSSVSKGPATLEIMDFFGKEKS